MMKINRNRGEVADISSKKEPLACMCDRRLHAVRLISKLNKMFLGYFEPESIFLDNENKQTSG